MDGAWRIQLLGGLRATCKDQAISKFPTRKTAELFAYLSLHSDRAQSREFLAELLWPDEEWTVTRDRLNQAISSLRRQFNCVGSSSASVFLSSRTSIQLNPHTVQVDACEFVDLISTAEKTKDLRSKVQLLTKAIDLYRGDFVPSLDEDWVFMERRRFEDLKLNALYKAIPLLEHSAELDTAIDLAVDLVAMEPLREEVHALLIRLYCKSGQLSRAKKQYAELKRILQDEFGEEISTSLKRQLEELLKTKVETTYCDPDLVLHPQEESPFKAASTKRLAIPVQLSRFFGREKELEEIEHVLRNRQIRLITLLGPGGSGKTRIAIEAAYRLAPDVQDNVWFVALNDIHHVDHMWEHLARTLNALPSAKMPPMERVVRFLDNVGRAMLVLDNFEQLVDEGAEAVRAMLQQLPDLQTIVTSRKKLSLDGEYLISVRPLPVPGTFADIAELIANPSVQLFIDRAKALRSDFSITPRNAPALKGLIRKLEGIPLAIELAASWSKTLSPTQLLAELSQRFDVLVSRRKDVAPRHRTLRLTLEDSFENLTPEQQVFLGQLTVFRRGWTLDAAKEICETSAARELLASLEERSLIYAEYRADLPDDTIRYEILETIREFLLEGKGTSLAHAELRHAAYYSQLSKIAAENFEKDDHILWSYKAESEHANFIRALESLVKSQNFEGALQVVLNLFSYWHLRGHWQTALEWLERLTRLGNDKFPDAQQARATLATSKLLWNQGEYAKGLERCEEAIAKFIKLNDSDGMIDSFYMRAMMYYRQELYQDSRDLLIRCIEMSESADKNKLAIALMSLGTVYCAERNFDMAQSYYTRAMQEFRSVGTRIGMSKVLHNLGVLHSTQGSYDLALHYLQEAMEIDESLGDLDGKISYFLSSANIYISQKQFPLACKELIKCADLSRSLNHMYGYQYIALRASQIALGMNLIDEALKLAAIAKDLGGYEIPSQLMVALEAAAGKEHMETILSTSTKRSPGEACDSTIKFLTHVMEIEEQKLACI